MRIPVCLRSLSFTAAAEASGGGGGGSDCRRFESTLPRGWRAGATGADQRRCMEALPASTRLSCRSFSSAFFFFSAACIFAIFAAIVLWLLSNKKGIVVDVSRVRVLRRENCLTKLRVVVTIGSYGVLSLLETQ